MSQPLTLFCLVDGEATSNAFPVEIESTKTIGDLKELIKIKKTPRLDDVAADELTLWRVSYPVIATHKHQPVLLSAIDSSTELDPTDDIADIFQETLPKKTIHILVQHPPLAAKRDREDDAEPSSSGKRQRSDTLMDAIEKAGLAEKAVVNGRSNLSRLDNKERTTLLGIIGQEVDETDTFSSLSHTALELHGANIHDMDKLAAPDGISFPVVDTNELFIREAYKDLHNTILGAFDNAQAGNEMKKHIVVTGTSGIGKSAFLVYSVIRLLAESDDDNPPIIIFHTKRATKCYAFGGRSTIRSGHIDAFEPFLGLPDTWYFVDSSPDPVLSKAKTVIAASPQTLFSDAPQFKDVEKEVAWRYYMAPWDLEELIKCRANVASFMVVPLDVVEKVYSKVGGVPRYVLQRPMQELSLYLNNLDDAQTLACGRVEQAIKEVKDPVTLMQFFSEAKESLKFSSRLIHRWPSSDHRHYRLEWASTYIAEEVAKLLNQNVQSNAEEAHFGTQRKR